MCWEREILRVQPLSYIQANQYFSPFGQLYVNVSERLSVESHSSHRRPTFDGTYKQHVSQPHSLAQQTFDSGYKFQGLHQSTFLSFVKSNSS